MRFIRLDCVCVACVWILVAGFWLRLLWFGFSIDAAWLFACVLLLRCCLFGALRCCVLVVWLLFVCLFAWFRYGFDLVCYCVIVWFRFGWFDCLLLAFVVYVVGCLIGVGWLLELVWICLILFVGVLMLCLLVNSVASIVLIFWWWMLF